AKDEKVTNIAQSVKLDILRGTSQGLQDATSKLMDLWLEDPTGQKLKAVLTVLQDELPADAFNQFKDSYLQPAIDVMSKIDGGSKVAEKYDYFVSVKSPENLAKLGMKFNISSGELTLVFADGIKMDNESLDGKTLVFDKNTQGIEIFELAEGSFMLCVNNKDGKKEGYYLTSPVYNSSYTPGSRYAVVSKNEINYTLSA
ncbi:MAG: hypothetical protein LBD99_05755, partial [Candidatus Margulisbacteria bacterium]|nr:hypothetical protein [Candidatus Margulisiibacteriota bacterium]